MISNKPAWRYILSPIEIFLGYLYFKEFFLNQKKSVKNSSKTMHPVVFWKILSCDFFYGLWLTPVCIILWRFFIAGYPMAIHYFQHLFHHICVSFVFLLGLWPEEYQKKSIWCSECSNGNEHHFKRKKRNQVGGTTYKLCTGMSTVRGG